MKHPHVEDRDDERAREVLGDPLAVVDLDDDGERLEDEGEGVRGCDREERSDVLRDAWCERHRDRVVDVLAEAESSPVQIRSR